MEVVVLVTKGAVFTEDMIVSILYGARGTALNEGPNKDGEG